MIITSSLLGSTAISKKHVEFLMSKAGGNQSKIFDSLFNKLRYIETRIEELTLDDNDICKRLRRALEELLWYGPGQPTVRHHGNGAAENACYPVKMHLLAELQSWLACRRKFRDVEESKFEDKWLELWGQTVDRVIEDGRNKLYCHQRHEAGFPMVFTSQAEAAKFYNFMLMFELKRDTPEDFKLALWTEKTATQKPSFELETESRFVLTGRHDEL